MKTGVERLYAETIKRFQPRELTSLEVIKLKLACEKTIQENPEPDIEVLLISTKKYLDFILSFAEFKGSTSINSNIKM